MIKLILTFFSILPLRVNHFFGVLIGHFLLRTNSRAKHIVRINIALCFPHLSQKEQQNLLKKSLIENGKALTEASFIWFKSFKKNATYITKINGIEHLKDYQPAILLVPHFGCWEITGRVLSLYRPITFLYKSLRDKNQENLLFNKRQQGNLRMAKTGKKGVMKLQRALAQGELIGILPDQDPGDEGGISSPFFKVQVRTMTLLVKLARKHNSKVLLTWASRLDKGRGYELNLKPIDILSKKNDINLDLELMNRAIEMLIKTNPQQYLWNYKRFKSVISY